MVNAWYYQKRKLLRLCRDCGREFDEHDRFIRCANCRAQRSRWRYGEQPAGALKRCKDCDAPYASPFRCCDPCREKRREANRRRRSRLGNAA